MEPADTGKPGATLSVELRYCPQAGVMESCVLQLPAGAVLRDALEASGWPLKHGWQWPEDDEGSFEPGGLRVGIWSKLRPLSEPLRDRDRIEVLRGLKVDPKEARRLRYKRQGGRKGKGGAASGPSL